MGWDASFHGSFFPFFKKIGGRTNQGSRLSLKFIFISSLFLSKKKKNKMQILRSLFRAVVFFFFGRKGVMVDMWRRKCDAMWEDGGKGGMDGLFFAFSWAFESRGTLSLCLQLGTLTPFLLVLTGYPSSKPCFSFPLPPASPISTPPIYLLFLKTKQKNMCEKTPFTQEQPHTQ